jgi:hypothetical protein
MDGRLIAIGRRLTQLSAIELLNFAYATIVGEANGEQRRHIDAALEGRLGQGGGILVDDPDLPASLQGTEAPSWWSDDHDPFAQQHTIG